MSDPNAGPSRRGLLAGLTGGAFLAAGGVATAVTVPPAGTMADLTGRYYEADAAVLAVLEKLEAVERIFYMSCPEKPDVLRHRLLDHFDFGLPVDRHDTKAITDDRRSAFYSPNEIAKLRTFKCTRQAAGGRVPCPEGQARVSEILSAWDAHEEATSDLAERIGLIKCALAYDHAVRDRHAIEKQIANASAITLDEIKLRAKVLVHMYDGELPSPDGDEDHGQYGKHRPMSIEDQLIWATIRDLGAI